MKPCDGTRADYYRHRHRGEQACPESRTAAAEYEKRRSWRVGKHRPKPPTRCGTNTGYYHHIWVSEPACDSCKRAHADHKREYGRGNVSRERSPIPDLILDVLETFGYAMTTDQLADHVTRIRPEWKRESVRSISSRMEKEGRLVVKEERIEGTNKLYLYWMP